MASTPANTETWGLTYNRRGFDFGWLTKRIGPMWNDNKATVKLNYTDGTVSGSTSITASQVIPVDPFTLSNLFLNYNVHKHSAFWRIEAASELQQSLQRARHYRPHRCNCRTDLYPRCRRYAHVAPRPQHHCLLPARLHPQQGIASLRANLGRPVTAGLPSLFFLNGERFLAIGPFSLSRDVRRRSATDISREAGAHQPMVQRAKHRLRCAHSRSARIGLTA